jgi:hypothetical protein
MASASARSTVTNDDVGDGGGDCDCAKDATIGDGWACKACIREEGPPRVLMAVGQQSVGGLGRTTPSARHVQKFSKRIW